MLLYRYLNLDYGLEALQEGQWKVGRLNELNDIYDCRPRIIAPKGWPQIDPNDYLDRLAAINGLICYSGTINDPVIWSHYADKHRGMALGFEFQDKDPILPHEVKYSKNRPVLDFNVIGTLPGDTKPDQAQTNLIDAGFSTKHPSWKYEQEYRHFYPLDKCRMKGRHYFRPVLWERISKIVLGAKCEATMFDVSQIVKNATMHQREMRGGTEVNVEISQCRMDDESFDLDFAIMPR